MSTNELRRTIEKKHRDALDRFKGAFMDDAALFSESRRYGENRTQNIGSLKSVTDRHAELTFGADRATLSYATEVPGLSGFRITLSMAGHHRMMGSRVHLSVEETDAWLYSILGDEWADHSYHAGAMTGTSVGGGASRLTTVYYLLYLSEDGQPIPQPPVATAYEHAPVQPDAFA